MTITTDSRPVGGSGMEEKGKLHHDDRAPDGDGKTGKVAKITTAAAMALRAACSGTINTRLHTQHNPTYAIRVLATD